MQTNSALIVLGFYMILEYTNIELLTATISLEFPKVISKPIITLSYPLNCTDVVCFNKRLYMIVLPKTLQNVRLKFLTFDFYKSVYLNNMKCSLKPRSQAKKIYEKLNANEI